MAKQHTFYWAPNAVVETWYKGFKTNKEVFDHFSRFKLRKANIRRTYTIWF